MSLSLALVVEEPVKIIEIGNHHRLATLSTKVFVRTTHERTLFPIGIYGGQVNKSHGPKPSFPLLP